MLYDKWYWCILFCRKLSNPVVDAIKENQYFCPYPWNRAPDKPGASHTSRKRYQIPLIKTRTTLDSLDHSSGKLKENITWYSGFSCILWSFLAATKQLYKWYFPSVCPSVPQSVTPFWLCSHHRIIIKFSGVISIDQSKVHAKGQGQRSRSQRSQPNLTVSGL